MIEERLRAHIGSLANPVLLEEITEPSYTTVALGPIGVSRRPLGRRPFAIAATLVAVASVVVFAADGGQPGLAVPGRWSVVEQASPVFAAAPSAPAAGSGDQSRTFNGVSVNAMISYEGGLIAVGSANEQRVTVAKVWRSDDGFTWKAVTSPSLVPPATDGDGGALSVMAAVASRGRHLVAFGTTYPGSSGLASWTSDDGIGWTVHELPPVAGKPATAHAVVATSTGYLAFANDNGDPISGQQNQPLVFRSEDGAGWRRLTGSSLDTAGNFVLGALTFRNRVIAFGTRGGHNGLPGAWASVDDGNTWQVIDVPFASSLPGGNVQHAAVTSDGLLLTGEARTASAGTTSYGTGAPAELDGDIDTFAWRSTDGTNLEPLDTAAVNTAGFDTVTAMTTTRGGALFATERTEPAGTTAHLFTWSAAAGFQERDAPGRGTVTTLSDHGGTLLATVTDLRPATPADSDTVLWRAQRR